MFPANTKNGGSVLGFPDVCHVSTPVVFVPQPFSNDQYTSEKLTDDVVKNRKLVKKLVDKDREKYSKCPYCAELVPSDAIICKTCRRYTKANSSTEYKCVDDYHLNDVCEAFTIDIIKVVHPDSSNKLTVETLTKEFIKTYNTLKAQFEKQVVKYVKCPHCSELITSTSTICEYCKKEV